MTKHTEQEVRYRVTPGSSIGQWLESLDLKRTYRVVDEYYDDPDGSFYKRGIFIRLRNDNTLEIKFNPAHLTDLEATDHIQCQEYCFPINKRMFDPKQSVQFRELENLIGIKRPAPFSFAHFLGCNQLRALVSLDKTRRTYTSPLTPRINIDVDTFEDLGTFVEFEATISNSPYPTEDFLKDIQSLITGLPLIPFNSGYVELALKEINEFLYQQGRYLIGK